MRVLLTGADNFTGSHVLAQLLSHDTVSVRAVVESAEAAHTLQEQHRRSDPSSLDFVTVLGRNSMTPGIFDDALHDLSEPFHAIVHIIGANLYDEADCLARFIKLETDSIITFLRSIQGIARAVSRVVIVTSLIPFARWLRDPPVHRASGRAAVSGGASSSSPDHDYVLATSQASSNIVSDAVLLWTKGSDARFDVVFVTAPSIYGPAPHPLENSSDLTAANRRIWNICSNEPPDRAESPLYGIDHFSDVRDVADATIRALFFEKASNKRLFISAGLMPSGFEIAQFLVARFPELQGRVTMDRSPPRHSQREGPPLDFLNTYLLTTILGISQLRSAEVTLADTVRQMLDLQQRKAWRSITQN